MTQPRRRRMPLSGYLLTAAGWVWVAAAVVVGSNGDAPPDVVVLCLVGATVAFGAAATVATIAGRQ